MSDLNIQYLQLVTRHQAAICGYIHSIAPGLDADDILQETNLILWDKAGSFEVGTNFKAFAFRIAHFKTLEALRAQKRGHWLQFDSELLESISSFQSDEETSLDGRQHALRQCLLDMKESERKLLHTRYTLRQTVRDIAKASGKSEGSLQQQFFRIRNSLRVCIEQNLSQEGDVQ